jgi:hypothetical protein
MITTDRSESPSRIPADRPKRQKTIAAFYVTLELSGHRVAGPTPLMSLSVARARTSELEATFTQTSLRLPSRFVSRRVHCTVESTGEGTVRVCDRGSTNGTVVNGRRLDRSLTVSTPCSVEVGPYTLLVAGEPDEGPTAVLREHEQRSDAGLTFDPVSRLLRTYDGTVIDGISPLQEAIVALLLERYPEAVATAELLEGVRSGGSNQALYSQINELRQRLDAEAPGAGELIRNRRNVGYSIAATPDA